jgi:hypothetical protein
MPKTFAFTVLGDPQGCNQTIRYGKRGFYTPAEVTKWKEDIRDEAVKAKVDYVTDRKWRVFYIYYHRHPERRLDVDSPQKVLMDSLQDYKLKSGKLTIVRNGAAYRTDRQVIEQGGRAEYDPDNPRLEVRLELTDIPHPLVVKKARSK